MLAARVTEQEVMSIPEPEWTKTWHPVSHAKVIETLELAVRDVGMEVQNRSYSLGGRGFNMFGTWVLDKTENGMQWMVGFRNSMSKTFPVGICAGTHVIVCSNMQFRGDDFIEFRRHTGGLDYDELIEIAKRAMQGLIDRMVKLAEWLRFLKERALRQDDFKVLTFDCLRNGVVYPQQFPQLLECYEMERKDNPDTGETLYQFNNGVTRLLRDRNLFAISSKSTNLINVINHFIEDHPVLRRRKGYVTN